MTTQFQDAASWLVDRLQDAAGRSVTYRQRGNAITITAIPSRRNAAIPADNNVMLAIVNYDWLLEIVEFEINGQAIRPMAGDLIIDTDGTAYTVVENANGREYETNASGGYYRVTTVADD